MSAVKSRSSCSFPNLLLSCLNFVLFILSAASFAPVILLRTPPTSLGLAFLVISSTSLASSFVGFYAHLTRFCFVTHVSVLLAALSGQVLGVLALFTKEAASLSLLGSRRDPREAKVLVRLECGVLTAMLLMEVVVLALTCAVHSCLVREYEGLGAERDATEKKRSMRMARVQEESTANAAKVAEVKAKELDERMRCKYGQWMKTDFEG
ncbi:hypothetical protein BT93_L3116 [Corymbia citriodora subsp. variegata]|uniref:Membrane lipoprotein n=1 Tax=Corymbia citriodora subsp. variegata TaxID=360336 RepID=A0A8T0CMN8_CORYI|nr:hypothetical protein BT93_L3116 [Corymbia citriodora subsp. variegata]